MDYTILEVQNLNKSVNLDDEKLEILKNINLTVAENEYIAIMGPSGSGKSTLLGILSCIDKPTSGSVWINGKNVTKLGKEKLTRFRNENIGIVFQAFNLIPVLTAEENIEMPLYFSEKKIDAKSKVTELLKLVGLEHKRKTLPRQLSGGEQQRIAIARALAGEPKVLLADEPTGALDSKNSEIILNLFDEFRKKYNMTIIMITHDKKVADKADRILYIEDGFIHEGDHVK